MELSWKKIKIVYKPYFLITMPLMTLFQFIYMVLWKISPFNQEIVDVWVDELIKNATLLDKVSMLLIIAILGVAYITIFIVIPIEITEKIYERYYPNSEFTEKVLSNK